MRNRIRQILDERDDDLSQEGLARMVDVSVTTISRIVNGKQNPRKRLQKAIAEALGRPVEEVFPRPAKRQRVA